MRGGENFDGRAFWIWLKPIEFVANGEFGRDPLHERVVRIGDGDFEFVKWIMTARTTAAKDPVVVGPIRPVVPQSGMDQQQSLSTIGKIHYALTIGSVGEGSVIAEVKHVNF